MKEQSRLTANEHDARIRADERERILQAVLDELKYDLFPVQVKMESPNYWSGYAATVEKVTAIINSLKAKFEEVSNPDEVLEPAKR